MKNTFPLNNLTILINFNKFQCIVTAAFITKYAHQTIFKYLQLILITTSYITIVVKSHIHVQNTFICVVFNLILVSV